MSSSERITLEEFIAEHRLSMSCEWVSRNPMMADDRWQATHYLCRIRRNGRFPEMKVYFSQGLAHTSKPELPAVLDCLASDAASVANAPDWLDWAEEFGFEDMRKARETHANIVAQAGDLRVLLGDDAFETLLWNVERI